MKKLLIIPIALLFLFQFSYAAKISLQDNQSFRINQGSVSLLPITITANQNNEITKDNGINIMIQSDYYFRFDANSLKSIVFSGPASSKIVSNKLSISPDLLSLHIPVTEDFLSQDSLIISGLNIIVYSKPRGYLPLLLDTNNDKVADATDIAGINIQNIESYRDITPPNEIFDLTGKVVGNILNLQWNNPGDIDFQVTKLQTLDSNKNLLKEDYRFGSNQATMEITSNIKYLNFQTIDERNNVSTGIWLDIDYFLNTASTNITTGGVVGSADNGSSQISSGVVATGSNMSGSSITGSISASNVSRYMPVFNLSYLSDFMIKFDIVINQRLIGVNIEKTNKILSVRNDIIKTLENYDKSRIDLNTTIAALKDLIAQFNNALML